MPGGDKTGPEGKGSMTGRGAGYCSGSDSPGEKNDAAPRRGLGRGEGRTGRGLRNMFKATSKTRVEVESEREGEVSSFPGRRDGFGRGRSFGRGQASGGQWYGSRRRPAIVPDETCREEKK